jgi:hypothetical protein
VLEGVVQASGEVLAGLSCLFEDLKHVFGECGGVWTLPLELLIHTVNVLGILDRRLLLPAVDADETRIEPAFCAAIRIAKEQKSISLEKGAEGTYSEYQRQKASASEGRGFRLPLW